MLSWHSMRLVTATPQQVHRPKPSKKLWRKLALAGFVLLILFQLLRPLPYATVTLQLPPLPTGKSVDLNWPAGGGAAVAAENYDLLAASGVTSPMATASIAKVVTALCVLEKYPLKLGQAGPLITIKPIDVAFYQEQANQNGSRLPVQEGGQLSEYQALQALLIPSANNIADTLAVWAFGSRERYRTYANAFVARHGLTQTSIGTDASGFDPSTASTAADLARLGLLARKQPVIMEIAGQKSVSFPSAGEYTNYNRSLGINGINGLKTGNNDQNPGGLLFTADIPVGEQTIHVSGTVIGAASLSDALAASESLAGSVGKNFEFIRYTSAGQRIGTVRTAWGKTAPVTTLRAMELTRWVGHEITETHTLHVVPVSRTGEVGALVVKAGQVQSSTSVVMSKTPDMPSVWWRLTRIR